MNKQIEALRAWWHRECHSVVPELVDLFAAYDASGWRNAGPTGQEVQAHPGRWFHDQDDGEIVDWKPAAVQGSEGLDAVVTGCLDDMPLPPGGKWRPHVDGERAPWPEATP